MSSNKNLPYFRWWVADAESDEDYQLFTDQELGFYHRCLNKAWLCNGLPADMDRLASLLKVSPNYLAKMWPRTQQKWSENGGRFFNKRQETERCAALSKSESSARSVRKRWETKREADTDVLPTNYQRDTDVLRTKYHSDPQSDSDADKESTEGPPSPKLPRPNFQEWEESAFAITERFPATDIPTVMAIIHAAVQAFVATKKYADTVLSDKDLSRIINAVTFEGQNSAKGYLRNLPTAIVNEVRLYERGKGNGHSR